MLFGIPTNRLEVDYCIGNLIPVVGFKHGSADGPVDCWSYFNKRTGGFVFAVIDPDGWDGVLEAGSLNSAPVHFIQRLAEAGGLRVESTTDPTLTRRLIEQAQQITNTE